MRIRLEPTDTHRTPQHARGGHYTRRSGGESAIATVARSLHLSTRGFAARKARQPAPASSSREASGWSILRAVDSSHTPATLSGTNSSPATKAQACSRGCTAGSEERLRRRRAVLFNASSVRHRSFNRDRSVPSHGPGLRSAPVYVDGAAMARAFARGLLLFSEMQTTP